MERNIDINEISDGRKYHITDMVKIGCSDCEGCSKCCEGMDGLITLDPYDIYRMCGNSSSEKSDNCESTKDTFDNLVGSHIDFIMDRGMMIPVLKMDENSRKCTYLNENGRCSIHDVRPGVCRLFPMGRAYEEGAFYYFLQKDECDFPGKTKVKLKKWMDTPEIVKYEKYICDWHYFVRDIQEYMKDSDDDEIKQINSVLIKIFFEKEYGTDFYVSFYERLEKVKSLL